MKNEFKVLATIDLHKFLFLPSSSLYKTLKPLHKERYEPEERIVIQYPGVIPHDLEQHFHKIITVLDIPEFVILIQTNVTNQTDHQEPSVKPLFNIPDTLCPNPWANLEFQMEGHIRTCCAINKFVIDDQGNPINYNTTPNLNFNELYFNKSMTELRDQFRQGIKPKECSKCWFEEEQGKSSDRKNYIAELKNIFYEIDYESEDISNLKSLDIRLGNICNLTCRICCPEASSSWGTEILSDVDVKNRRSHPVYLINQQAQWIRKSNSFWKELEQHLPNIELILIAGGEPMMIPELLDVLQLAAELGYSQQITLRYNTNGTIYSERAIEIWKKFKLVRLLLSIDDIFDRFEYQRTRAEWSDTVENIKKYQQESIVDITICCTVSVQNVLYLPELYNWCISHGLNDIYFNLLFTPTELSIQKLTPKAKELVLNKLTSFDFGHIQDKIIPIIKLIRDGVADISNSDTFTRFMSPVDIKRGQHFSDAHIEMAEAMGYVKNISN